MSKELLPGYLLCVFTPLFYLFSKVVKLFMSVEFWFTANIRIDRFRDPISNPFSSGTHNHCLIGQCEQ